MSRIYVALSTFGKEGEEPLKLLRDSGIPFEVNSTGKRLTGEQVVSFAKNAKGIIAGVEPYDAPVLNGLPHLRCISRCGVGVDNIDLLEAQKKNILILNTPDVVIQPVAELAVAMMFDLSRKLTAHTELFRARKWEKITGSLIAGKTIGIVGLGRIGRKVANMASSLGANVIGFDVLPDKTWAASHHVRLVDLNELLSKSDIVSLHISTLSGQPFCLDRIQLQSMKPGAYLINTARGSCVHEGDLVDLLKSGHLGGVGMDVFEKEPYNGPLCDCPNVVLTPHVATLTKESRLQMETEAVANILKFFKG